MARALAYLSVLLLAACAGEPSETVRVVGSSTVFPFAARAAEGASARTGARIVVEQTGSGGGHKLLCAGPDGPDATTSSRAQEPAEREACRANGVGAVVELELGRDGIVLARAAGPGLESLSRAQLHRALAAELPDADCRFRPNPNRLWSDVDADLPARPIVVHGPPPTSGTRDAFVRLVMVPGARAGPCAPTDAQSLALREDGAWVDAGENDNALVQTLLGDRGALGVVGLSTLERNAPRLDAVAIDGVRPGHAAVLSGDYPAGRTLYAYVRADRLRERPGVRALAEEMVGAADATELIPLGEARRAEMRARLDDASRDMP